MSETQRMAKLLVEHRDEAFRSRYSREESKRRVDAALQDFKAKGMVYETAWRDDAGATVFDVHFAPSRGARTFLNCSSLVLTLLLAVSLWSWLAPGEPVASRALIWLGTAAAILAFPFAVMAYGSRRDAEEATLRRRVKRAIVDDPANEPQTKRGYDDED